MKIFVTGATGFTGSFLVRALLKDARFSPAEILVLVRDPERLPGDLREKVRVLQGDGASLERYQAEIRDSDLIFHIGAKADFGNGKAYRSANTDFTRELVRIAEGSARLKRFVFTSTIGAVDRRRDNACTAPLDEASEPHPASDYGRSKLECEKILRASGLPFSIVRPGWVYGPGMRANSHLRVFAKAVDRSKFFTRFHFPGRVSLIHVEDLVEILMLAAIHPSAAGQTFFAAADPPVSLGQIFRWLGEMEGKPKAGGIPVPAGILSGLKGLKRGMPLSVQNLFWDVLWASPEKIRRLGWVPKRTPREGILEMVHAHFAEEKRSAQSLKKEKLLAGVTGGASGIGRALSEILYARGYDLAIFDRETESLRDFERLNGVEVLQADLAGPRGLSALQAWIRKKEERLTVWVNNAGLGKRSRFEELSAGDLNAMFEVDCKAPVLISREVLEAFRKSGGGTLVQIGSSAGFQPLPYMAVYAAAKAFLHAFSEGVRGEFLCEKNIRILTVAPSGTDTRFQERSGVRSEDRNKLLRPAQVAASIVRRIESSRPGFLIVGHSGKGMALAARLLPAGLRVRIWDKLMRKWR